jgi:hypothetical protein
MQRSILVAQAPKREEVDLHRAGFCCIEFEWRTGEVFPRSRVRGIGSVYRSRECSCSHLIPPLLALLGDAQRTGVGGGVGGFEDDLAFTVQRLAKIPEDRPNTPVRQCQRRVFSGRRE